MLSQESLAEFKQIMLEDYGIKLTDQQAIQDAVAFLEAVKVLVVDIPHKEDGNVS